jgi:hypothetical protein
LPRQLAAKALPAKASRKDAAQASVATKRPRERWDLKIITPPSTRSRSIYTSGRQTFKIR